MQELFITGLGYVSDCEEQLIKALPKMAQNSSNSQLKAAFEQHLKETENHAQRLKQIFAKLGKKPGSETNEVVKAMTKEADGMISSIQEPHLRDAALIVAGNQVEHYEMAAYGSLRNFAQELGMSEAANLLEQTLQEEKAADAKLTQIGNTSINREANHMHAHA